MFRPELAGTLEAVAEDPLSFYKGSLANAVLQDLREIGKELCVHFHCLLMDFKEFVVT